MWLINANEKQRKNHNKTNATTTTSESTKKITKNCAFWLSLRTFSSIADCLAALKEQECTIWATDVAPEAVPMTLTAPPAELPTKLAIVIGRALGGLL